MQRNPDGTFPKGVSGNPKGCPTGSRLTKAGAISRVVDTVLRMPLDDLIEHDNGKTNLKHLTDSLQEAYQKDGIDYMMRVWLPIAQIVGRTNLQIDIAPKQPLRIVLTNGNGKHGGNGEGHVIDVEPAQELNEGG